MKKLTRRSRRPDHFSERFLGDLRHLPLLTDLIAVPRQQQKGSRQPLFAGIKEVIDQIRFDTEVVSVRYRGSPLLRGPDSHAAHNAASSR
jgi:hypothetical protein